MDLKTTCSNIWLTKFERKGIKSEFKPVFVRFIGTNNIDEYNDIMKTLQSKVASNQNISVLFDGEIPLDGELAITFGKQLDTINSSHIELSDIEGLFPQGSVLNQMYVNALNYVIELAEKNENFPNQNIQKNFVKKMIVWTFSYIKQNDIHFDEPINPKCIYYGDISKHEIYFLILLYRMTFDVLFINPLSDEITFKNIDKDNLSELCRGRFTCNIETFEEKCEKGNEINSVETFTSISQSALQEDFYTQGVYKPWQFRNGTTSPVFINGTIMDIEASWEEPAKVRQGFAVKDQTVYVPYFFQKIEGEYSNIDKYKNLIRKTVLTPNTTLVVGDGFSEIPQDLNNDEMLSLTFCLAQDETLIYDKVKEMEFYQKNLGKYKKEVQKLIINKINELFKDRNMFNIKISRKEKLQIAMLILSMKKEYIKMIDNFDFTSNIPKIVVFLENEAELQVSYLFMLAFFSKIGFDIIIYDPSGLYNPCTYLKEDRIIITRLDEMNYERTYDSLKIERKKQNEDASKEHKGFFSRIFGI